MTHLDGRTIPISRKGTTQPNEVEVIEGEGVSRTWRSEADEQMPSFHDIPQGDMYIEYSVVMPTAITTETRDSEFQLFLSISRESNVERLLMTELLNIFGRTTSSHDEL